MVCTIRNEATSAGQSIAVVVATGTVNVIHAAHDMDMPLAGFTIEEIQLPLRDVLNVAADTDAYIDGRLASVSYRLRPGDRLEFLRAWGRKGARELPPRIKQPGCIDISTEKLLLFGEVAARLPRNYKGNRIHTNTIWRWATKGLSDPNGQIVRLEWGKIGGRNCTSAEALQRFFDRLKGKVVDTPLPSAQAKRAKLAEEELKKLGF